MRGFFFFLLCLATGILAAEFRSMPLLFLAETFSAAKA